MLTSEIFYSIQGEGPCAGIPSVFLRTAVCNLYCSWCDTKYSWEKQYAHTWFKWTHDEILQKIKQYPTDHLVVTGGEPTLWDRELASIAKHLPDYHIEIETNGTIIPCEELCALVNHWNVSPKTSNSHNRLEDREKQEALRFYAQLPNSYFKFVVCTPDDLAEIQALIAKYGIRKNKVILMPEATTREKLIQRSVWLIEVCKEQAYRFSTRIQTQVWETKRGV